MKMLRGLTMNLGSIPYCLLCPIQSAALVFVFSLQHLGSGDEVCSWLCVCVCVCVCVCARARVRVCVCVTEREREQMNISLTFFSTETGKTLILISFLQVFLLLGGWSGLKYFFPTRISSTGNRKTLEWQKNPMPIK